MSERKARFSAMVVVNKQVINAGNQADWARLLDGFGMSLNGTETPFGILFPAGDWVPLQR